jgi:hypothetical protein
MEPAIQPAGAMEPDKTPDLRWGPGAELRPAAHIAAS